MWKFILTFFCCLCIAANVLANEAIPQAVLDQISALQQAVQELQSVTSNQTQMIESQSAKINFLENRIEKVPSGLPPAVAPSMPAALGDARQGLANWNPEVGVIGDVVTHLTEDTADEEGKDSIAVRELELVFGQYVDPYSRFDAAVVLNDALEAQNVEIEQAYFTRYALPLNFKAQVGKIRPKIGKANLIDRHALDTVTEPLVINRYFGEEGWKTSGVRLQNFIPNPWDIPLEVTGEVLNGRGAPSFAGKARRPVFNTHLKSFFEVSDTKSLEIGATSLFGSDNLEGAIRDKGNDRFATHVYGFDVTYIDLLDGIRRLKLQSELYFQDRDFPNPVMIDADGNGAFEVSNNLDQHPWGFYSLLDLKLSQRFSAGVRFDFVKPLDAVAFTGTLPSAVTSFGSEHTWEVSPYITLYQSEFALFRLQYSHTENAQGISDDQIYLQGRFQIGVDRHGLQ